MNIILMKIQEPAILITSLRVIDLKIVVVVAVIVVVVVVVTVVIKEGKSNRNK